MPEAHGAVYKDIIIVVNTLSTPAEELTRKLEWIVRRFEGSTSYDKLRFVYYGDEKMDWKRATDPKALHRWIYYRDSAEFYSYLMEEGFFQGSIWNSKKHFDFALMLRLASDAETVFDWGLLVGQRRRCILRALFLAARGNVLFGHWGSPSALNPQPEQALFKRSVLHAYLKAGVQNRNFSHLESNRPFMKVFDHYLVGPTSIRKESLSEEHLAKIEKAMRGEYFSPQQLLNAQWNAHFHLYFAQDGYSLLYHQWRYCGIHFERLQMSLIFNYIKLRSWSVSSSWLEILVDSIVFGGFWALFVLLNMSTQQARLLECMDEPYQLGLRYLGWVGFWNILFFESMGTDRTWVPDLCRMFGWYVSKFSLFDMLLVMWMDVVSNYINDVGGHKIALIWIAISFLDMTTMFYDGFRRNIISFLLQVIGLSILQTLLGLELLQFAGFFLRSAVFGAVLGVLCFLFRTSYFRWVWDWERIRSCVAVPLICSCGLQVCATLFTLPNMNQATMN